MAEQLTVRCQGAGEPVYLIGGGPAFTTWNLEPIQGHLRKHYRVCRWDMRGVGDNAGLTLPPDKPALSVWLADMAAVLPPEPVLLWGHSWGALQSLLFARQFPQRVRGLILSNPVDPALKSLEGIERKRYRHPELDSLLSLDDMDTPKERRFAFREKIASYFLDGNQGWAYSAGFDSNDTNNALNVRIWDEYRQAPITDADMSCLTPKLAQLIFCRRDVLMPENLAEYVRTAPSAKRHVLSDCAHFPWEENPTAFYTSLSEALRRL